MTFPQRYPLELLLRMITASLETMKIDVYPMFINELTRIPEVAH